ncbi:MAG: hypothetical protein WCB73_22755 [Pseudonocardiaceae bacterium]
MAPSPSTLDRTVGIRQDAVIVGTGSSGGLADGDPIPAPRPNTDFPKGRPWQPQNPHPIVPQPRTPQLRAPLPRTPQR